METKLWDLIQDYMYKIMLRVVSTQIKISKLFVGHWITCCHMELEPEDIQNGKKSTVLLKKDDFFQNEKCL